MFSTGALAAGALVGFRKSTTAAGALPDLTITSVVIPSGLTAGQAVSFAVVVANQGTGATPAGITIGVGFHVDSTEVSWSGYYRTSLAAGASVTLLANGGSKTGGGTWIASAGSHTLTAVVNDVHRFAESNTANNTLSATFTVAAAATKPVNTVPPQITGTPQVGDQLTASTGTWT